MVSNGIELRNDTSYYLIRYNSIKYNGSVNPHYFYQIKIFQIHISSISCHFLSKFCTQFDTYNIISKYNIIDFF